MNEDNISIISEDNYFSIKNDVIGLNEDYIDEQSENDFSLYQAYGDYHPKSKCVKEKIFNIQKEKRRAEKKYRKLLLKKKQLREGKNDKKYIIVDNKVIRLSNNLTNEEKNEIRVIRNRISAQQSRDRKKEEEVKLIEENQKLKNIFKKQRDIIDNLNRNISLCSRCRCFMVKNENFESSEGETEESNINIEQNIGFNTPFGCNKSFGIFCLFGIITMIMIFNNTHYYYNNKNNITTSNIRKLKTNVTDLIYEPGNHTEKILSLLNEEFPIDIIDLNKNELRHMYFLREHFLLNLYTKLKVEALISNNNNNYKQKYFLSPYSSTSNTLPIEYSFPFCYKVNDLIYNTYYNVTNKNATLLVEPEQTTKQYTELRNHVQSLFIKDYLFFNEKNKVVNFEEWLSLQKGNNINKNNENECSYFHIIFPSSKNKNLTDVLSYLSKPQYYEIGCMAFEINKIME